MRKIVLALLLTTGGCTLHVASSAPEIDDLRARTQRLETQVEQLGQRVETLTSMVNVHTQLWNEQAKVKMK